MADGRSADFDIVVGKDSGKNEQFWLPFSDAEKQLVKSIEVKHEDDATSEMVIELFLDRETQISPERFPYNLSPVQAYFSHSGANWLAFDGEVVSLNILYPRDDLPVLKLICMDKSWRLKRDNTVGVLGEGTVLARLQELLAGFGISYIVTPKRSRNSFPDLSRLQPVDSETMSWGAEGDKYKTPWQLLVDVAEGLQATRLFVRGNAIYMVDDEWLSSFQTSRFDFVYGDGGAGDQQEAPLLSSAGNQQIIRASIETLSIDSTLLNKRGVVSVTGWELGPSGWEQKTTEPEPQEFVIYGPPLDVGFDVTSVIGPYRDKDYRPFIQVPQFGPIPPAPAEKSWLQKETERNRAERQQVADEITRSFQIPTVSGDQVNQALRSRGAVQRLRIINPDDTNWDYEDVVARVVDALPPQQIQQDAAVLLAREHDRAAKRNRIKYKNLEKLTTAACTMRGDPRLDMYTVHSLRFLPALGNILRLDSDKWRVRAITHHLDADRFDTEFTLQAPKIFLSNVQGEFVI